MTTVIPSNRAHFTADEVMRVTKATGNVSLEAGCTSVTSDSRGDVLGKLFVALVGERFDAHGFVADVLARGAWGVLVEHDIVGVDPDRIFRVSSTLSALGALARYHRQRWRGQLVTIGGSAGKTTTRAATTALLEAIRPGRVHSTVGNLNNLVGVPMTLLGLEPHHDVAVVELGTNQRGEVARLAAICQANVAVLTCIGLEHTLGLGDLDGVAAEEADLFSAMSTPSYCIGNCDDVRVSGILRRLQSASPGAVRIYGYGVGESSTHRIVERRAHEHHSSIRILRKLDDGEVAFAIRTRLVGLPGALASTAALAVADAVFGPVGAEAMLECALDRDIGQDSRLKIIERSDRALVIDDCYNANPISMRSSIAVAKELANARQARLVLVLGDMLELGQLSRSEHVALVSELGGAAQVLAVGAEMRALVTKAVEVGLPIAHYASADDATQPALEATRANDVLLVKGSRGVRLERVVAAVVGGNVVGGKETPL